MEVDGHVRRVVDVKIPALTVTEKDTKSMPYGFADTNSSIDRAAKQIKELMPKICKAAEYENSIFSLAKALEKTQKLLNALENVIIPQYKDNIRFILSTLEERERLDFDIPERQMGIIAGAVIIIGIIGIVLARR